MLDPPEPNSAPGVASLLDRAAALERELFELERSLSHLGAESRRQGLHLVVEAGGHRALLEGRAVVQIARLVEFTPIPGAPSAVLGGFVRRGASGVAIDLAAVFGSPREPELDAHLVIVGGTRTLGIVVDRVRHVVEAPPRVDPRAERLLPALPAELVASWCDVGGWLVPLVTVEAIERVATRRAADEARPRADDGGST